MHQHRPNLCPCAMSCSYTLLKFHPFSAVEELDITTLVSLQLISLVFTSMEIPIEHIRPASLYFEVEGNTSLPPNLFMIPTDLYMATQPQRGWHDLKSLNEAAYNGEIYAIGDWIYVRTQSLTRPVDIAQVAEIKAMEDSRKLFHVFWCYARSTMTKHLSKRYLRLWPSHRPFMRSSHSDVIMWDSATGKLDTKDIKSLCTRRFIACRRMFGELSQVCMR